jgi:hypothetical protein
LFLSVSLEPRQPNEAGPSILFFGKVSAIVYSLYPPYGCHNRECFRMWDRETVGNTGFSIQGLLSSVTFEYKCGTGLGFSI